MKLIDLTPAIAGCLLGGGTLIYVWFEKRRQREVERVKHSGQSQSASIDR